MYHYEGIPISHTKGVHFLNQDTYENGGGSCSVTTVMLCKRDEVWQRPYGQDEVGLIERSMKVYLIVIRS